MSRQEYNDCLSGRMRNRKLTKAERQTEFCKSSKVCSGKASSDEEAAMMCATGSSTPAASESDMPCSQRIARAIETMEQTRRAIQEGQTDDLKSAAARMAKDVLACNRDPAVVDLTRDLSGDLMRMSGQYYYINEGKEVIKTIDVLQRILSS